MNDNLREREPIFVFDLEMIFTPRGHLSEFIEAKGVGGIQLR